MRLKKEFWCCLGIVLAAFLMAYYEVPPIKKFMDWGTRIKAASTRSEVLGEYASTTTHTTRLDGISVLLDITAGEHFWHPQLAVWTTDAAGDFLETLFVTRSTAKGLFLAGRTAANFKSFDAIKDPDAIDTSALRLVDALPYWSHQRGQEVLPDFFAPTPEHPVPDAISGATPQGNFYLETRLPPLRSDTLQLYLEVNVAFDDNAYYSEYDFPDDERYHGGTGLLGQPSLIYRATIPPGSERKFLLMELIGHSHHSGRDGKLYTSLDQITTAKAILDRILVRLN